MRFTAMLNCVHLFTENGMSRAAHLHLCPGDAADSVTGGKGWQQHPSPAAGNHQVCHHQVSFLSGGGTEMMVVLVVMLMIEIHNILFIYFFLYIKEVRPRARLK